MNTKLGLALCVLLTSCSTGKVKSQIASIEGNWIVTRCLSVDPADQSINNEEISANLGGKMVVSENIVTNLNGVRDTCHQAKLSFETKDVKSYFDNPKFPALLGLDNAGTVRVAKTNCNYFLSEFFVLNSEALVISVDGFLLFLDKQNEALESANVVADKLAFYSDNTLKSRLNYYVVKGDNLSVMVEKNKSSFVKYSGKGKHYYGWVNSDLIQIGID